MKTTYEAPELEIQKVAVEEGYSASLVWTDEPANDDFEVE